MNPKRDVSLSSFNPLYHKMQKLLEKSLWFALLGYLPGKQFILRQKQMIVTAAKRSAVNYVWSEKHFVMLRFLLNVRQVFYCQELLKAFQTNSVTQGRGFFKLKINCNTQHRLVLEGILRRKLGTLTSVMRKFKFPG